MSNRWVEICKAIMGDIIDKDPKMIRRIAIDLQTKLDTMESPNEVSVIKPPKVKSDIIVFGTKYLKAQEAADFLGIVKSKFHYHLRKSRQNGFQDVGEYLKTLKNFDDIITNAPKTEQTIRSVSEIPRL